MDINLVVLSAGNTRLAVGTFLAGDLTGVRRVDITDRNACAEAIRAAWGPISELENAEIAGACVNPPAIEPLEAVVEEATGQAIQWVGRDLDRPIKVKTNPPEDTGVDRVLALAAAYEQLGHACIVVDAGTALTVNVADDSGAFVGGAILPGAKLWLNSLHEHTAKLPQLSPEKPDTGPGDSTKQAMLGGMFHGLRGAVKELVERHAEQLGRWPEVIVTGGDAELLFGDWELTHAISPDLVLYGLAAAYAEHHIKHAS
jgi:type III pantothenate kinase